MSELIGFTYNPATDVEQTPVLARAIDEYVTDLYGDNTFVSGHLAFDANHQVVASIEFMVFEAGREEDAQYPHGNDGEAWDNFIAWMQASGSTSTITFMRRPHSLDTAEPADGDMMLVSACENLCPKEGFSYHGHVITNGQRHGLLMPQNAGGTALADVMQQLGITDKAALGRELLATVPEGTDPVVVEALRVVTEHYEQNTPPTPESRKLVNEALVKLQASLDKHQHEHKRKNAFDVPDINARPNVPPAFYN